MLGTLNGALEARGISLEAEAIRATVEGDNEVRDGIIVLTRIRIHYELHIPRDARAVVERALARHQEKCPTARSLQAAVEINWTADIAETGAAPSD